MTTISARNAAQLSAQVARCPVAVATTHAARNAAPPVVAATIVIARAACAAAKSAAPESAQDVLVNKKGVLNAMKKNSTENATTVRRKPATLRFSPTAWAKLLFLRDLGDSEIGGFGITPSDDLLY